MPATPAPGREIGSALGNINAQVAEQGLLMRLQRAKEILRTIPNGTADADLTPEQKTAFDEYDGVSAALARLRDDE